YLVKIQRVGLKRYVYCGTIAAFLVSAGVAGALIALTWEFQGVAQQLFEGITMLVAVAVLTSMVLWMIQAARSIKVHVQERIDAVLRQSEVFGLGLLSFVIVLREGVETAIFPANETNTAGYLLRGIIGYSDAPTLVEVAAYFGYWIVVILAYLGIRTGKITIVTAPLRKAWDAMLGRRVSAGAEAE